jgi:fibronectin-binding autotransporter adhesin
MKAGALLSTTRNLSSVNQARRQFSPLIAAILLNLLVEGAALAQNTWTGAAGTTNWTDPGNWSFGVTPTGGDVLFDNTPPAAAAGIIDNIVGVDFTINSFGYQTVSTNGFHTTQIPAGVSLNINGAGGNAVSVGIPTALNTESLTSRLVGGGTLTITNATGAINAVQYGANNDHRATLDLSGLTNFSASLGQVLIGAIQGVSGQTDRPMGGVLLAETNFIQTAAGSTKPGILVAGYPGNSANVRGTQQLFFGRHNVISADAISVGGFKVTGQIGFRAGVTNGDAIIRGSLGGTDKVKVLSIGDQRAGINDYFAGNSGGTSANNSGTFDMSGNTIDVLATDLYVARSQTNGNGVTTGILTFDQGNISADNIWVGFHPSPAAGSGNAFNAVGTVNVNGTATLTANNDLVLTRKVGTSVPTAALNLSANATVNVKGNIVTTNGTSTITFNGGTINMQPSGDATPGNISVSALSGNGAIINAANVTNTASITPGTATTAGTLNIGGNLTLPTGSVVNFNLADTTAIGGVNDLISVSGNLNLNNNTLSLTPLASSLAVGSYRLFNVTGTETGTFSLNNPTRYTAALAYPANQVNLNLTGGGPGSVRWASTTSSNWDLTTTNWINIGTASADRYFQLDSVVIDDAGAYQTNLLLSTTMYPGPVVVNASALNYNLGGSGKISGPTSLTKSGTGTLTITNANDFTGPVTINAGTLRTANASALGATNSGTTVAPGGTLDLFGTSLFNPGEFVTISGTGATGGGAIINSGADQNNGLRSVSLAADSAIGSGAPGRWDIRGPGGSGSFSGGLYLNGFTLTKLGAGKNSLVDSMVTNKGSIVISNGILGMTRSVIDGSGSITVVGTNMMQIENFSTGYVAKPLIFTGGGGTLQVTGNGFTLFSPISDAGGMTIDNAVALTLTNSVSGAGALTKISAGTLTLQAPDTRTGPTTISAGRLTLTNAGSLGSTPSIALGNGASLDASAVGGLTLASGQTLSGSGLVIGDVVAGAGTAVIPGSSAGTLSLSNNLTLSSSSNVFELSSDPTQIGLGINDLIAVNGDLTVAGVNTIKVVPLASLNNASPYTLFTYAGTLSGGAANLNVGSDSRYAFTVVDPVTTPGVIQVNVSGSGTSASLLWKGGAISNPNTWDTKGTANWLNGLSPDVFFLGDNVVFDDTATVANVSVSGTVQPASMLMSNSVVGYSFGGSGSIVAGSFSNEAPASAVFQNTGPNSFASSFVIDAGTVTFANPAGNTFSSGATINVGTLNLNNAGGNGFGAPVTINGGSVVLNQAADTIFGSVITDNGSGAGLFEKRGLNSLTLSGNNASYNGGVLVSSGMLRAGNNNALGTASGGTIIASGATFDINGFSLYNPGDLITISGTGLNNTGAVINTGAAQQNAVRALALAGDASVAAWLNRWDVRGPGGSGSGSGLLNLNGFTLTKLGPGQVSVVDADMTSSGIINVNGGILTLTRDLVDGLGYINLANNVLLLENYSSGYINKPLVFSGGIFRMTGNAFTMTAPITNNLPGMTFDLAVALSAQGTISGPGSLTKIGTSSLILTAPDSTWSGSTTISAGTLQIGSGAADGSLADLPMVDNGSLLMNSATDFAISNQISGTGGISQNVGGTFTLGGSNSFGGQVLINSAPATSPTGGAIRITNSYALGDTVGNTRIVGDSTHNGRLELAGNISCAEPVQVDCRQGVTIDAPAVLNVSGNNTMTGPIVGSTGGSDMNFQSDSGKLTMAGTFNCVSTAGTRRLKLMGDGAGEWSGAIANSVDTLVATLIAKTGNGTWTLSGTNIYRGSTTIRAGTLALAVSGSISNSSVIDVQGGAIFDVSAQPGFMVASNQTLKGNGNVTGSATIAAFGTLSAGESVGSLTFSGSVALAAGSTNIVEIDKANLTNDLVNAASVIYNGTLVVSEISGTPFVQGDTFRIFNAGSYTGSFAATSLPALDPGLAWDLSKLRIDGTISVGQSVNTTPTNMTFQVAGNSLDISWPSDHTGWRLQGQTNAPNAGLTTNWFDVPGSTATNHVIMTINPANGSVFYRLLYP